ncbi:hypothetical protein FQA39_LY12515 [Lamprigera yunnana]|nr:hypothetical protein FQA39_LY12515 [Lamprigera yunnana]
MTKKLDAHIKITSAEPHEPSTFKAAVTKAPCQEDLLPTNILTSANVAQNDTEIEEIYGYSDDSIDDLNYQPESLDDNISEGNEYSEDDKPENVNDEIVCPRKRKRLRKNTERRERDKNSHQLRSPCVCKKRCVKKLKKREE